ncbi:MAG: hypothetical protein QXQ24_08405 [Nitrososphaeria archaeon]
MNDYFEYEVLDTSGDVIKKFYTFNDSEAKRLARLVSGASVLKTIARGNDGHIEQEDFIQL